MTKARRTKPHAVDRGAVSIGESITLALTLFDEGEVQTAERLIRGVYLIAIDIVHQRLSGKQPKPSVSTNQLVTGWLQSNCFRPEMLETLWASHVAATIAPEGVDGISRLIDGVSELFDYAASEDAQRLCATIRDVQRKSDRRRQASADALRRRPALVRWATAAAGFLGLTAAS